MKREDCERFSDVLDFAAELEERERQVARFRLKAVMPRTGSCYACGAGVLPQAYFCDASCQEDYEREEAARRRAGTRPAGR